MNSLAFNALVHWYNDFSYPTQYPHVVEPDYGIAQTHITEQGFEPHPRLFPPDATLFAQPEDVQMVSSFDPAFEFTLGGVVDERSDNRDEGFAENTENIPATLMGPPNRPRKRKAPTRRVHDWEPYKARIIELHVDQDRPLEDVREQIEADYGFTATVRQYRTRVSQWKKDKNIKPREMEAIVRKQQQRNLVENDKGRLEFKVRDNAVEPQKIVRWMKRKAITYSALYAPSPAASTPSDVFCRTISEHGSPVPSHHFSPVAHTPSPSVFPVPASPLISSPALSVTSIVRPQSSTFAGQSPALAHRSLPIIYASGILSESTVQDHSHYEIALPLRRYKQDEEDSLRESLYKTEELHGVGHAESLDTLFELGNILLEQGRLKSAEEVIRKLLEYLQAVSGNKVAQTLAAQVLLARLLHYQGYYAKSEKLYRRVLESRRKIHGDEHPYTLTSYHSLGWILLIQCEYDEAEIVERKVLEARERLLGAEARDTLGSVSALATILTWQKKYEEARVLHQRALEAQERVLGPEHEDTLTSIFELGWVLFHLKRYEQAEHMQYRALEAYQRLMGPEHPATLRCDSNLALTFVEQGKYGEAESMQRRDFEKCGQVLGSEHPETLTAAYNLALTLKRQGRKQEALLLMRRYYEAGKRVLGPQHPQMNSALRHLNNWEWRSSRRET